MAQLGDRTWYEWDIETIDKRGNIEDHDFDDKLANLARRHRCDPDGPACFLVLVRNWGNEHDGLLNRQWAYVTRSGELPNEFDGGDKVPQKFKTELRKHQPSLRPDGNPRNWAVSQKIWLSFRDPEDTPGGPVTKPDYRWIIDKDLLQPHPPGAKTARGTAGPYNLDPAITANAARFQIYDDDGECYYEGRIWGDFDGFEPLDDFGTPNAGCTAIKIDGAWL